ncbi:hypothetical protein [Streptomyces sp. NPDC059016]|uniref:hypothetical protein n=1 Tax=Streptomyces sp. NPDC059016 TaxID=3346699 RepID=UPI0036CFE3DD
MPAYLITHAESRRGDMLIEDPDLVLALTDNWARFNDQHGIVLAIPTERIASIQRVDEDQEQEPAPQKE